MSNHDLSRGGEYSSSEEVLYHPPSHLLVEQAKGIWLGGDR